MQEIFRRRDLPHWDVPGAAYFVTSCLQGSIPAQGLLDIRQYDQSLRFSKPPPGCTRAEWAARCWKLVFARIDYWLDQEPAIRHLKDPTLANIVMNSLLHFASDRYDVLALVVMPSHFHWVFRPREEWVRCLRSPSRTPRERIMQSVKSYSAAACNRHRCCQGTFWQEESYDHWIRDVEELERVILYVEHNPVRAKLVERPEQWQFSSARIRHELGLPFGVPLIKR